MQTSYRNAVAYSRMKITFSPPQAQSKEPVPIRKEFNDDMTPKQILDALRKIRSWDYAKADLYNWISVLDQFDALLVEYASNKNNLAHFERHLLIEIIRFSLVLLQNCQNAWVYSSIDRLVDLLDVPNPEIVVGILLLMNEYFSHTVCRNFCNMRHDPVFTKRLVFLLFGFWWSKPGFDLKTLCRDEVSDELVVAAAELRFRFNTLPDAIASTEPVTAPESNLPIRSPIKTPKKRSASTPRTTKPKRFKTSTPKGVSQSSYETIHIADMRTCNLSPQDLIASLIDRHGIPSRYHMALSYFVRFGLSFSDTHKRLQYVIIKLLAFKVALRLNWMKIQLHQYLREAPQTIEEMIDLLKEGPNVPLDIQVIVMQTLKQGPLGRSTMLDLGACARGGFIFSLIQHSVVHLRLLVSTEGNSSKLASAVLYNKVLYSMVSELVSSHAGMSNSLDPTDVLSQSLAVLDTPDLVFPQLLTRCVTIVSKILLNHHQASSWFLDAEGLDVFCRRLLQFSMLERSKIFFVGTADGQSITPVSLHRLQVFIVSLLRSMASAISQQSVVVNFQCMSNGSMAQTLINLFSRSGYKHDINGLEHLSSDVFVASCHLFCALAQNNPPCIASLHNAGVTRVLLSQFNPDFIKDIKVLKVLPESLRSCCLNPMALAMVQELNTIYFFFSFLSDIDAVAKLEDSTVLFIRKSLDELFRHSPAIVPQAMHSIASMIKFFVDDSPNSLDTSHFDSISTYLHAVNNIAQILDTILSRFASEFASDESRLSLLIELGCISHNHFGESAVVNGSSDLIEATASVASVSPSLFSITELRLRKILDDLLSSAYFDTSEYLSLSCSIGVHLRTLESIDWLVALLIRLTTVVGVADYNTDSIFQTFSKLFLVTRRVHWKFSDFIFSFDESEECDNCNYLSNVFVSIADEFLSRSLAVVRSFARVSAGNDDNGKWKNGISSLIVNELEYCGPENCDKLSQTSLFSYLISIVNSASEFIFLNDNIDFDVLSIFASQNGIKRMFHILDFLLGSTEDSPWKRTLDCGMEPVDQKHLREVIRDVRHYSNREDFLREITQFFVSISLAPNIPLEVVAIILDHYSNIFQKKVEYSSEFMHSFINLILHFYIKSTESNPDNPFIACFIESSQKSLIARHAVTKFRIKMQTPINGFLLPFLDQMLLNLRSRSIAHPVDIPMSEHRASCTNEDQSTHLQASSQKPSTCGIFLHHTNPSPILALATSFSRLVSHFETRHVISELLKIANHEFDHPSISTPLILSPFLHVVFFCLFVLAKEDFRDSNSEFASELAATPVLNLLLRVISKLQAPHKLLPDDDDALSTCIHLCYELHKITKAYDARILDHCILLLNLMRDHCQSLCSSQIVLLSLISSIIENQQLAKVFFDANGLTSLISLLVSSHTSTTTLTVIVNEIIRNLVEDEQQTVARFRREISLRLSNHPGPDISFEDIYLKCLSLFQRHPVAFKKALLSLNGKWVMRSVRYVSSKREKVPYATFNFPSYFDPAEEPDLGISNPACSLIEAIISRWPDDDKKNILLDCVGLINAFKELVKFYIPSVFTAIIHYNNGIFIPFLIENTLCFMPWLSHTQIPDNEQQLKASQATASFLLALCTSSSVVASLIFKQIAKSIKFILKHCSLVSSSHPKRISSKARDHANRISMLTKTITNVAIPENGENELVSAEIAALEAMILLLSNVLRHKSRKLASLIVREGLFSLLFGVVDWLDISEQHASKLMVTILRVAETIARQDTAQPLLEEKQREPIIEEAAEDGDVDFVFEVDENASFDEIRQLISNNVDDIEIEYDDAFEDDEFGGADFRGDSENVNVQSDDDFDFDEENDDDDDDDFSEEEKSSEGEGAEENDDDDILEDDVDDDLIEIINDGSASPDHTHEFQDLFPFDNQEGNENAFASASFVSTEPGAMVQRVVRLEPIIAPRGSVIESWVVPSEEDRHIPVIRESADPRELFSIDHDRFFESSRGVYDDLLNFVTNLAHNDQDIHVEEKVLEEKNQVQPQNSNDELPLNREDDGADHFPSDDIFMQLPEDIRQELLMGSVINDEANVDFLSSLPSDLRQDYFMTSDDEILGALPSQLLAEAVVHRQRGAENEFDVENMDIENDVQASTPQIPESRDGDPLISNSHLPAIFKPLYVTTLIDVQLFFRLIFHLCTYQKSRVAILDALMSILIPSSSSSLIPPLKRSNLMNKMPPALLGPDGDFFFQNNLSDGYSPPSLVFLRVLHLLTYLAQRKQSMISSLVLSSDSYPLHLFSLFNCALLVNSSEHIEYLVKLFNQLCSSQKAELKNFQKIPGLFLLGFVSVLNTDRCSSRVFELAMPITNELCKHEESRSIIVKQLAQLTMSLSEDLVSSIQSAKLATISSFQRRLLRNIRLLSSLLKENESLSTYCDLSTLWNNLSMVLSELFSETREHYYKPPPFIGRTSHGQITKMIADRKDGSNSRQEETLEEQQQDAYAAEALRFLPLVESFFVCNSSSSEDCVMSKFFLEFTEKHRRVLNTLCRKSPALLSSSFKSLLWHPARILSFDNKWSYFRHHLKNTQVNPKPIKLFVRRDHIFEDSFHQIRLLSVDELHRKLSIRFHNEEGVDAGGLTREWFLLLSREIFNPNYALFTPASNNAAIFQPNKFSYWNPEHLSYFHFVGRFVGKALFDGFLLDAYFTRSFFKHMLEMQPNYHDIESIDPEFYKSLVWMLNNSINGVLDLTMTIDTNEFGDEKVVELMPDGANIAVTDDNKEEYVRLITSYRMTTEIQSQISSFLEGFRELIPSSLSAIFNEHELELLICGLPEIDIWDLRKNTEYYGYTVDSPVIGWFWEVVEEFSHEERALLVQFVTGTSKVPLSGFVDLQGMHGTQLFQIHKAGASDNNLPSAHTCINQLDLPEYSSKEILRAKLTLSLREASQGFGFA